MHCTLFNTRVATYVYFSISLYQASFYLLLKWNVSELRHGQPFGQRDMTPIEFSLISPSEQTQSLHWPAGEG